MKILVVPEGTTLKNVYCVISKHPDAPGVGDIFMPEGHVNTCRDKFLKHVWSAIRIHSSIDILLLGDLPGALGPSTAKRICKATVEKYGSAGAGWTIESWKTSLEDRRFTGISITVTKEMYRNPARFWTLTHILRRDIMGFSLIDDAVRESSGSYRTLIEDLSTVRNTSHPSSTLAFLEKYPGAAVNGFYSSHSPQGILHTLNGIQHAFLDCLIRCREKKFADAQAYLDLIGTRLAVIIEMYPKDYRLPIRINEAQMFLGECIGAFIESHTIISNLLNRKGRRG